ncbi:DoxX family protein [Flavobacteriaceae bacterium]|nr:DoxX family protein [Flavobacteriales bacterium]MBL6878202.1 DoxX family protein [Flavobacteriaceae bacterium]MDA9550360.1 DoxX family protein [Flavobacteriaceae bacterium]MDA9849979.1 DoxX family protein [Flavobacteriaceae bacterium]MDB2599593.1 DoxX family protein [Flavobacteriaceae bacterium]
MNVFLNHPAETLILLFLIVTFLQSGVDKLIDWRGNLSFIKGHFKNSPLKNSVPLLLGIILIMEILASLLMIIGIYQIHTSELKEIAILGVMLSGLSLIFLLIGQRLAKDYAGAMTLAVYFIITIIGLVLLTY